MLGIEPQDRLVLQIDLADYIDREDFETRVAPDFSLLSKERMISGVALERRAAQESVRELLTKKDSQTLRALRQELEQKRVGRFAPQELVDLVSELLG